MRRAVACVLSMCVGFLLISSPAPAQDTLSIHGRVTDRQGGAVVGATMPSWRRLVRHWRRFRSAVAAMTVRPIPAVRRPDEEVKARQSL